MPYLSCDLRRSLNEMDVLVDNKNPCVRRCLLRNFPLFHLSILYLLIFVRSCNQNTYFQINPFIRQAFTDNVYSFASSIKIFMLCFSWPVLHDVFYPLLLFLCYPDYVLLFLVDYAFIIRSHNTCNTVMSLMLCIILIIKSNIYAIQ